MHNKLLLTYKDIVKTKNGWKLAKYSKAQHLLNWYDNNARTLPWRVSPRERLSGLKPDAYRVWLSEIMLQQTTVAAVTGYFERFVDRWPTISELAKASDAEVMSEWAGLGYYARARNLLKCARILDADFDGKFPQDHAVLLKLPGIGPYTAAAISAIAFDKMYTVVDTNVERVMSRLFEVHNPLPNAKKELVELAASLTPKTRTGDYAQAVMDLGATICKPKRPDCQVCPWQKDCAAKNSGNVAELPKKLSKKKKNTRYGIIYFVEREDGALLLETRPNSGLLGGMLCWPCSEWTRKPIGNPPLEAKWKLLKGEVKHTFTHFHIRLAIQATVVGMNTKTNRGVFILSRDFYPSNLPTVMQKIYHFVKNY